MYNQRTKILLIILTAFASFSLALGQVNDNCSNATTIVLPNGGFGNGVVYTDTIDIATATAEIGEYYSPGVPNGKSVWFKFSLPTTKKVIFLLDHLGTNALNTAGWSLYRNSTCLPGNPELLDPPIFQIEGYTHSCLLEGDYYLQLSADFGLSDSLFFRLDVLPSDAAEVLYDYAADAYDFGVVSSQSFVSTSYEIGCQSLFDVENTCVPSGFTKSTWHTFTTDNFVDLVRFRIGESPWNAPNTDPRLWYVNLYEGDITMDSTGLTLVDSCVSMAQTSSSSTYWPYVDWQCNLDSNTTYSIQVLSESDYFGTVVTQVAQLGIDSTQGADATNLNSNNSLGGLNLGQTYTVSDYFACNSQWDFYSCPPYTDTIYPSQPATNNPLNWWVTFDLLVASSVDINVYNYSGSPMPGLQLFQGDVETGCNLIPVSSPYYCLDAGSYSLLVTGDGYPNNGYSFNTTNLGKSATVSIEPTLNSVNQFGLQTPGSIDSVNGLAPLTPGQVYSTTQNYFDCLPTVMPQNEICENGGQANDRAMYRLVHVDTSGYLTLSAGSYGLRYKLFQGDLSALPIVGNEIIGTTPLSCCSRWYYYWETLELCVDSGLYTIVTFADEDNVDDGDQTNVEFNTFVPPLYTNPLMPEILDTVSMSNQSVTATQVQAQCFDNSNTILGNAPCSGSQNLFYREFYLEEPLSLDFVNNSAGPNVQHRVFAGQLSQNNLTSLVRDCFISTNNSDACDTLSAGWYTIVSYRGVNLSPPYCGNSAIGDLTGITVNVNLPLDTPFYNTYPKADSVFLEWSPRVDHTDTIPSQWQTYSLDYEQFNCIDDLAFPAGITPCFAGANRISYRVIHIDKPSYLYIYNIGLQSVLYEGDITANPPPYTEAHPCTSFEMRACLQPGVYTFVTFAANAQIGTTFSADLYVDSLGTSKYDFASNAYNYGLVPNDGVSYFYNPSIPADASADAYGRPASNDFIFCSTGASLTDPEPLCNTFSNASGNRKNLWYTFELNQPGTCTVNVNTLTPGKLPVAWAIYECANNNYPLTDSTLTDLTLIARSKNTCYYWVNDATELSFTRDACSATTTKRYVVMVTNTNRYSNAISEEANIQVQVGVTLDPIGATAVQYDHYSQASEINGTPTLNCSSPNPNDTISYGTYIGCEGNLLCATLDPPDQNGCGANTIWYKFNAVGSGNIRINWTRTDNSTVDYNANDIMLFREVVPGDSTSAGLQQVPLTSAYLNTNTTIPGNNRWGVGCFSTGTYYIMFTGCNFPTATVRPNIWLENISGDYCYDAIPYIIDSEDSSFVSGTVDCWTIGEAPGEDGSNMDCLGDPVGQKSGWFRLVVDADTAFDINISLNENTTAPASEFSYRIANGDCNSLTYQNCVEDGGFLTLNLKCRQDSALYIQVVLPDYATGTVDLNISTTISTDTSCAPVNPFIPNASFNFVPTCENEEVVFINESTQGPDVTYLWDFGDGFTSNLENPSHLFTSPSTGSYLVTLIVENLGESDTTQRLIDILPTPDPVFTITQPVQAGSFASINNFTFDTIPGVGYFWEIGSSNNIAIPTDTIYSWTPNHYFDIPGEYFVCFTVSNAYCEAVLCDTIDVVSTAIFAGGPYDGFSTDFTICPDILQPIFAGGPYDGFDNDYTICPVVSPFAGGPYDGEGTDIVIEDCTTDNLWSGGPFDGEGTALFIATCITQQPIFAGGPYDGFDTDFTTCPDVLQPIFAGGPYDGFDLNITTCPPTLPIFAGGPYDGFDLSTPESVENNIAQVCEGENAILSLGFNTDWYSSPTSLVPLATDTNVFVTPPLSETTIYYYSSPCYTGIERSVYVAEVLREPTPDFSLSTSCAGQVTTFTNQTLVSGPQVQTIGTIITGLSPAGGPPSVNNASVSTANYTNFARFNDGVLTATAWSENNTIASTEWLQVNYITPRSLNEIDLWHYYASEVYHPSQIRLYYSNGGPWELAYVDQNPASNTIGRHYNSGLICASANIYATRWKIEFDTRDAYRMTLNEILLYASQPVIGGTVNWNIDGTPASGSNVTYTFPNPGFYDVIIEVSDSCSCIAIDTQQVEIIAVDGVDLIVTDLPCNDSPLGELTLDITTTAPVDYEWYNGDSTSIGLDSLDTGNYWIYVESVVQGCGDTIFADITEPLPLDFTSFTFNPDSCLAIADVSLTPSGGTAPYVITWNGTDVIDTLLGVNGWNVFEIVDSNNCSLIDSIEIIVPLAVDSATILASSCFAIDTGTTIQTLTNTNGCDSIVTTITSLLPSDTVLVNAVSCFAIDTGTTIDTLMSTSGCDSVVTTITTLLPSDSTFDVNQSCFIADTGIFILDTTNLLGCDSVHTLTVTLLQSDSTSLNSTSCLPADTGVFVTTNPNQFGCDSVHTLTVTLDPTSTSTETLTSCDSIEILGTTYFTSTTFNDTIIGGSVNGCDSIVTYDVTINFSETTFFNSTSCLPADTGVFVTTNPNQFGCDSVHTLTVTLDPTSTSTETLTSCDSIDVLGITYFTSTTFNDTLIGASANGCDSIVTYDVTINFSESSSSNSTSCLPADTGVFVTTNPNQFGCDSVHTSTVTLDPTSTSTETLTSCDSIDVLGTTYFTSTTFNDTLIGASANGCDSIVTYDVTINFSETSSFNSTSCLPADTGVFVTTNPNQFGCDSVHTLTITLDPTSTSTETLTSCDSIDLLGTTYFTSTTFNDTIIGGSVNGCDSIVTYDVTINFSETSSSNSTSCLPADTGVFVTTNPNQFGCDSVHTLTVTLDLVASSTETLTSCDSIDILGTTYYTSTTFNDTLIGASANGCDSIVTYDVTINFSETSNANSTSCLPGDTGVFVTTNPNQFGCDSVHTLTVTLDPTSTSTETLTSCDSIDVLGTTYFTSTTFNDTLIGASANGCDSIVTYDVTINFSETSSSNSTSCLPADTGVFVTTNPNQFGCDSVHTLTITLDPTSTSTETLTSCDSIDLLGTTYFASTLFNDTLIGASANGCDSIVTYDVTINFSESSSFNSTSCLPADTGVFVTTNPNQFGCDSVHTLTITLDPTSTSTETLTSCDSIDLLGTTYFTSTTFNDTIIGGSVNGCDSIVTYDVTINFSETSSSNSTSCLPADTGVFVTTNPNQFGCDSVHTLTVTLDLVASSTETLTSCDSIDILGTTYYTSTTFNDTLIGASANGCDSIVTYDVTINFSETSNSNSTSCLPGDTGVFVTTNPNQFGCDSVHTLTITLAPTSTSTETLTNCDSIDVLGTTYFTSTTFNDTLIGASANGCDSIVTYDVTINFSETSSSNSTSCLPADTGVFVTTNPNQFGCDSVHTLTITLDPTSTSTETLTSCDSIDVLGTTYFTSTTFNDTIIGGSVNGCDSIVTYDVTINFSETTSFNSTSCLPADTGVFVTTNPNQFGCDSVHTLTVTLDLVASSTETLTSCDSINVLGTTYFSSATFNDTILGGSVNGCDSIVTYDVTINFSETTSFNSTSCLPADTGVFVTTNPNQFGCDSVHTLTVTLDLVASSTETLTSCDSLDVLGTTYFSSTTFNDTILGGSVNGCDSIVTYDVTINFSETTSFNSTSCLPADTGVFVTTNPNQFGCDSVHTLTVTLDLVASSTETLTSCDSIDVLGTTYFTSTTFNDTIIGGSVNGCDSIVTYDLTINFSETSNSISTSCLPGDTGVFVTTNPNQFGCDSVHTLTVTLDLVASSTETLTSCDSIDILGTTYFSTTTFNDTILGGSVNGCDSIVTYDITINNSETTSFNSTSCLPADTGVFVTTNPNQFGCDSVHTLTVTLDLVASSTETLTSCDSIDILGTTYFSTTTFNDTILGGSVNGCDSIVTYDITINNSETTSFNSTSCLPADTGVFVTTNPNQFGCDSVHTLTVTLDLVATSTEVLTSCDSIDILGTTYFSSTTFNDTIIGGSVNGCDSIVTYDVTINFSETTSFNSTSCLPADTGVFVTTNPNQFGCDSVHTLTVTLDLVATSTEVLTSCDSLDVLGTTYFTSTTFNDTIIGGSVNGCDSIVTYDVTINFSETTSFNSTSCLPADTGVFVTTNPNQFGCDSVHTLTVTLDLVASSTETLTSCDSIDILGTTYLTSTTFNDTIIGGSVNGCDSIVTYDLTINFSETTSFNSTSCLPADTGVFVTTNPNQFGCDSVHTLTVTLDLVASSTETLISCDSLDVLGTTYFTSTTFNDTIIGGSVNGCDSIVTYDITINNSETTSFNSTSCLPADTGVFVTTNPNQFGCDSVHTLTVTLDLVATSTEVLTSCDSLDVLGTTYFASTTFNDTIIGGSVNGCDSIVTYDLTINFSETISFNSTSCLPADTGVFVTTNPNQFGCDSVHTLTVTLDLVATSTEVLTSCDSIDILGTTYFSSTTFNDTIIGGSVNGCDSIVTYDVTINFSETSNSISTSCLPGDTGVFVTTNPNQFGCDSVHTLTVTLDLVASSTETLTSCDSIDILGTTYFSSTTFNDTIIGGSVNGCDSIVTYDVTINFSETSNSISTSCLPGDTGVFVTTNPNQFGCDSVHTLTVTLDLVATSTEVLTSCDSLDVLGTTYLTSTTFNDTIIGGSVNGCDSIVTYDLTINFSETTSFNSTSCLPADTGVFVTTNPNQFGCDSVHTLTVTLDLVASSTETLTSCDSIDILGTTYLTSTTFNDTIIGGSVNGCDSIVTYDLTINFSETTSFNSTSCLPADTGVFVTTNPNQFGCDSVHTLTVTLDLVASSTETLTSCDSIDILGTTYFSTTTFNDTILGGSVNGCDSIVTYDITINNSETTSFNSTSCLPADTGVFVTTNPNQFGCDSVHTLTVTLLPSNVTSVYLTSCEPMDTGIVTNTFINQFGCDSTVTTQTTLVLPIPVDPKLGDTIMCLDEVEFIQILASGSDFIWSDGSVGEYLLPDSSGTYTVTFIQDSTGCLVMDTINITLEDCNIDCYVMLPTAFSPGASIGMNDVYQIITNCDYGFTEFNFTVFNRWGEIVFYTNDPDAGWDGIYQGLPVNIGVYTYLLEYTEGFTGKENVMKGNVTVIK